MQISFDCCNNANLFRLLQQSKSVSIVATMQFNFDCCYNALKFRLFAAIKFIVNRCNGVQIKNYVYGSTKVYVFYLIVASNNCQLFRGMADTTCKNLVHSIFLNLSVSVLPGSNLHFFTAAKIKILRL